jgi:hypothetical protein
LRDQAERHADIRREQLRGRVRRGDAQSAEAGRGHQKRGELGKGRRRNRTRLAPLDVAVQQRVEARVVIDEGRTRRGADEIRAWRENVATAYEYTTELRGVTASGDGMYVARVHLEGNFPGGTVDLRYRFTIDAGAIRALEIG